MKLDDLSDVIADDEIWRDAMMAFAKSWPWFAAMWRRESDGSDVTPEPFEALARVVLEEACKAACEHCRRSGLCPRRDGGGYGYDIEGLDEKGNDKWGWCVASPIRKLMEATE